MRQLALGPTVSGTITRMMPYGAFARVTDGVEGLIHVSELAVPSGARPGQKPLIGDVLG